jgi:hypothetical protein
MDENHIASLDVTPEAQASFVEWVSTGLAGSVWNSGGCKSYYLSPTGFNFTFWPGFAAGFKKRMTRIDLDDHTIVAKTPTSAVATETR